jgi:hypothetical protein
MQSKHILVIERDGDICEIVSALLLDPDIR